MVVALVALDLPRRLCRNLLGLCYGPYARRRIARRSETWLRGRRLLTDPDVLHPVVFRSTGVLVDFVETLDLAGKRFLDMGSGSGAVGVFAAARGARVTSCDVNPRAVALTRDNLRLNGLDGEVVASDLFAAIADRRFDLICFNIPFYAGVPRTPFEAALYGGENLATVRRFAEGCPGALDADGRVVVVFSEDADRSDILALFAAAGFAVEQERIAHRLFERFHVVIFRSGSLPERKS